MDPVLKVERVGLLVVSTVVAAVMVDLGDHGGAVDRVVDDGGGGGDGVVDDGLGDGAVTAVVDGGPGGADIVSSGVSGGDDGGAWTETDKMMIKFLRSALKCPALFWTFSIA